MDSKELAALQEMTQPMDLQDEDRLFRAIFYGDFGAGKTSLAAECVRVLGGNALWVTTDSGYVVLEKYPDLYPKIQRVPFVSMRQLRNIAQAHDEGIQPYADVSTLVWDTVSTSVQDTLTGLVGPGQLYFEKEQLAPTLEGRPQYRMVERSLIKTIKILRDSKLNIIFITHMKEPSEQEKNKGKLAVRPNMPEASYNAVAREASIIGYVHKEKRGEARYISCEGTITEAGKSQIPTIPEKKYKVQEIPPLLELWKTGNYQIQN